MGTASAGAICRFGFTGYEHNDTIFEGQADVAQLVEQLIRNQQVVSSSLTVGSNLPFHYPAATRAFVTRATSAIMARTALYLPHQCVQLTKQSIAQGIKLCKATQRFRSAAIGVLRQNLGGQRVGAPVQSLDVLKCG